MNSGFRNSIVFSTKMVIFCFHLEVLSFCNWILIHGIFLIFRPCLFVWK
jgi:hypothetical protein